MPPSTRMKHFTAGIRDTVPMLVGAAPFGMIFGTLVATAQMQAWQGQLMSLAVFAGSSQFIATGLIASHTGMLVIWLATFIVNLRHMLYAAALMPHVRHLPRRWRWGLGFLLTDETFAVVERHYRQHPQDAQGHWYFLGSGLSMYVNWQFWTLTGLMFGAIFPQLQTLGLDFAMVATFIAIVVPQLFKRPHLLAAIVAGSAAYALQHLPYKLGLLVAIAFGVATGMLVSRFTRQDNKQEQITVEQA
ncbi:branched-chain amino acid efflux pump permease component 1 AzlC family protein [Undibacterium sp. YM2]|uniref:AzlC family ABC transporter permease n=1 Tax=Undibacterium sp. YM2 TaxID=2058625 RepID=UPI001331EDEB|nr:AzlC family ABC transporter permease [Undibacterium sp. YM2]BBB70144.1 branched-chain amino acid efflux pump permease component 1 AzlC family protein [Undibacterium sp. YM2]